MLISQWRGWDWYPAEFSLVVVVVHPTKHHCTALHFVSVERGEGEILGGDSV